MEIYLSFNSLILVVSPICNRFVLVIRLGLMEEDLKKIDLNFVAFTILGSDKVTLLDQEYCDTM